MLENSQKFKTERKILWLQWNLFMIDLNGADKPANSRSTVKLMFYNLRACN